MLTKIFSPVVVAVGNIGTSGIMLTAAPATAHNVISVGSQFGDHVPGFSLNLYAHKDSDYYDLGTLELFSGAGRGK